MVCNLLHLILGTQFCESYALKGSLEIQPWVGILPTPIIYDFDVLTWSIVAIKDAERQEGPITVGCKGSFSQRGQVIHVVKGRPILLIKACQQEVDMIRSL